jgi:hypothetical protein
VCEKPSPVAKTEERVDDVGARMPKTRVPVAKTGASLPVMDHPMPNTEPRVERRAMRVGVGAYPTRGARRPHRDAGNALCLVRLLGATQRLGVTEMLRRRKEEEDV